MADIDFDRSICEDPAESRGREWLETNGLGGFASSTLAGANTRRYHGLLTAAIPPPAARFVLLSKLEETLIAGGERFELSTNFYPGVVHPEGDHWLTGFRLDPFPIFTFQAGGATLEKRVFMVQGENTVVIEYKADSACKLELRPLIAFRGYHELTHSNSALNGTLREDDGSFSIQPYDGMPPLRFAHNAHSLRQEGNWYRNFEYPLERERGLDFQEDLYCPCVLEFDMAEQTAVVIASAMTDKAPVHGAGEAASLKANEVKTRTAAGDPSTAMLTAAARQFIVQRGSRHTVIAGYPWFCDWGRDTMIALPGLTLSTGMLDVARDILLQFSDCIDRGMLPNNFPEAARPPEHNTVDATLWFFEAIRLYMERSGDAASVRKHLYEKLKDIVDWHLRGTRYGIHTDDDGLLCAGDPMTQLTWMDARVDGRPVTPRNGKPVEIQALWYNALQFMARLAHDFGEEDMGALYARLAMKVGKNFNIAFWNEEASCLYDVVDGDKRDASLRPNQVIALSLGYCAFSEARARKILAAVEQSLLTPFGLRTLAPSDPNYRGRYGGSVAERDSAYHQGTVWPWLLGPFIAADARCGGNRAASLLDPLRRFAASRGVGQIPEIFDGDPPHERRGCFAQAWSVAEILRSQS